MSMHVYDEITPKKYRIIPPNYTEKSNFSCPLVSANFIDKHLKCNITNEKDNTGMYTDWGIFKFIRSTARHKFAHGESDFLVNNDNIIKLNKQFDCDFFVRARDHYLVEGEVGDKKFQNNLKRNIFKAKKKAAINNSKSDILDWLDDELDKQEVTMTLDNDESYYKVTSSFSALQELNSILKRLVVTSSSETYENLKS